MSLPSTGKQVRCIQSYSYRKRAGTSRTCADDSAVTSVHRGASFLQDHSHYAVAQKKYVFIYDRDGVELHRLKSHIEPTKLEFLPFHWLLATVVRHI